MVDVINRDHFLGNEDELFSDTNPGKVLSNSTAYVMTNELIYFELIIGLYLLD